MKLSPAQLALIAQATRDNILSQMPYPCADKVADHFSRHASQSAKHEQRLARAGWYWVSMKMQVGSLTLIHRIKAELEAMGILLTAADDHLPTVNSPGPANAQVWALTGYATSWADPYDGDTVLEWRGTVPVSYDTDWRRILPDDLPSVTAACRIMRQLALRYAPFDLIADLLTTVVHGMPVDKVIAGGPRFEHELRNMKPACDGEEVVGDTIEDFIRALGPDPKLEQVEEALRGEGPHGKWFTSTAVLAALSRE